MAMRFRRAMRRHARMAVSGASCAQTQTTNRQAEREGEAVAGEPCRVGHEVTRRMEGASETPAAPVIGVAVCSSLLSSAAASSARWGAAV